MYSQEITSEQMIMDYVNRMQHQQQIQQHQQHGAIPAHMHPEVSHQVPSHKSKFETVGQ
jgi:hypothetical protein